LSKLETEPEAPIVAKWMEDGEWK